MMLKRYNAALAATVAAALVCGRAAADRVIAVNFDGNRGTVAADQDTGIPGFPLLGSAWNNRTQVNETDVTVTGFDTASSAALPNVTATLTYTSPNLWGWGGTDVTGVLRGYLDDGGNQAHVTLADIPFDCYDVYLFAATDNPSKSFRPVTLNGVTYSSDADGNGVRGSTNWGASQNTSLIFGQNLFHVDGLTGSTLTIDGGNNDNVARGCIAAVLVVEHGAKIVLHECGDGIAMSEANAIDGDVITLAFNAGGVLTIDELPTRDYSLQSAGAITVAFADGIDRQAALDKLIAKGVAGGAYLILDSAAGAQPLGAPTVGFVYRYEGTTALPYVPYYNTAYEGTVEVACPLDTLTNDGNQFVGNKGGVTLAEGSSLTAPSFDSLSIGNQRDTEQHFKQYACDIVLTKEGNTNDNNVPFLTAHWLSTVTYDLVGGSITVGNGIMVPGWDGQLAMTVGGGANAALLKVKGMNGTARNNPASLTLFPNGTLEISGTFGILLNTQKKIVLAGGTLKFDESCAVQYGALEISSDSVIDTGANLVSVSSDITGSATVVKRGAGTLNVGMARPFVDVQEGVLRVVLTPEELAAGALSLPVPANATALTTVNLEVVDEAGNAVPIANLAVDEATQTLAVTLSLLPSITSETTLSAVGLATDATGLMIIQGAATPEEAYTVTFDTDLPAGVNMNLTGYVTLAATEGRVLPLAAISLTQGAEATIVSDINSDYTVPAGATLVVSDLALTHAFTVNGTLRTEGTVVLSSGNNRFNGSLVVASGEATVDCATKGLNNVLTIASGATLRLCRDDQVNYDGTLAATVYGTLDCGTTRQSLRGNCVVYLGDGAVVTGTGGYCAAGGGYTCALDFIANNTVQPVAGLTEAITATIDAPLGTRGSDITCTLNAQNINLRLTQAASGTGAVKVANAKGLTVEAGTWEVGLSGATNLVVTGGSVVIPGSQLNLSGHIAVGPAGTISFRYADILNYNAAIDIDIAGTWDMTVRQSFSSNHHVTLHPGARITGSAGDARGDFEYFASAAVKVAAGNGPVFFDAELGIRDTGNLVTFSAEGTPGVVALAQPLKENGSTIVDNVVFLLAPGVWRDGHHQIADGKTGAYLTLLDGITYTVDDAGTLAFAWTGANSARIELAEVNALAGDLSDLLATWTTASTSKYKLLVSGDKLIAVKGGFTVLIR